jgi:hypothetical protein
MRKMKEVIEMEDKFKKIIAEVIFDYSLEQLIGDKHYMSGYGSSDTIERIRNIIRGIIYNLTRFDKLSELEDLGSDYKKLFPKNMNIPEEPSYKID